MLILSLAEQSARLIFFFLGRDMKQETKDLLEMIARALLYTFNIVILAILIVIMIGHIFILDACLF